MAPHDIAQAVSQVSYYIEIAGCLLIILAISSRIAEVRLRPIETVLIARIEKEFDQPFDPLVDLAGVSWVERTWEWDEEQMTFELPPRQSEFGSLLYAQKATSRAVVEIRALGGILPSPSKMEARIHGEAYEVLRTPDVSRIQKIQVSR